MELIHPKSQLNLEIKKFININLKKGTSNYLEFENSFFDIVFCGSFLMWIDRELVFKTLSEIDRVLKEGGFLNIVDFDVIVPYKMDISTARDYILTKMITLNFSQEEETTQ